MAEQTTYAPEGWGDDTLTAYFDMARENQYATYFQLHSEYVNDVILLDSLYRKIGETLELTLGTEITGIFFISLHRTLRAASDMAMRGSSTECYCLLRLALETSAYGLAVEDDIDLTIDWLRRTDSDEQRLAFRNQGKFARNKLVGKMRNPEKTWYEYLYELSIDHGAHPNCDALMTMTEKISKRDGNSKQEHYHHIILTDDKLTYAFMLEGILKIGTLGLLLYSYFWKEKIQLQDEKDLIFKLRDQYLVPIKNKDGALKKIILSFFN